MILLNVDLCETTNELSFIVIKTNTAQLQKQQQKI